MWIVVGGEIDLETNIFLDNSKVEFVGVFNSYEKAAEAWQGRSRQTVDNAIMKFFMVPFRPESYISPHYTCYKN